MRLRYLGPYPLIEDNSLRASAETVINLRGAWKFPHLTVYAERTSDVVLGIPGSTSGSVVASNIGVISNKGVEATVTLVPLRNPRGVDWTIEGRYAKNSNTVDELRTGSGVVSLTPSLYGVTVQARQGSALGALVGTAYKRDASGALVLQSGLPVAESQARVLGVMSPDWTGSVTSTVRYWNFELSGLLDIHRGGSIFSATNLWGMSSGTFQETAFRPDTGIVIAGVDAVTGKSNTQHVSTEDYYHALRGIAEPWIYDASFVKLRDLRLTFALPLRSLPVMTAQSVRVSLIGRNLTDTEQRNAASFSGRLPLPPPTSLCTPRNHTSHAPGSRVLMNDGRRSSSAIA